jgi:acyl-CoA ligase (AMP-forming) (exosortase A-associated)
VKFDGLLDQLIQRSATLRPDAVALVDGARSLTYGQLDRLVEAFAFRLMERRYERGSRIGIFLEKRTEGIVAAFGAARAGCVFVPINPILKPEQVGYILGDCDVELLVTSRARLNQLDPAIAHCAALREIVIAGDADESQTRSGGRVRTGWSDFLSAEPHRLHRAIDADMVAILYTSGSTGRPKGVVLSHRNMVEGARSVSQYLENAPDDVLLAALPLSFDAGFSQLTTAFTVGARVVLLNYLLPGDVLRAVVAHRVTGITGVPPLWIQLAQLRWPSSVSEHLRYFANTGGRMPRTTLDRLRSAFPGAKPYLMYGLTEAFRSTYLPPEEVDARPDSIGKAIPGAEILVLREDGTECAPGEPGELVHRGALVGMGYWNDPEKTAERYRPLPNRARGLVIPEMAVFSGDTVRRDEEGFLYFIGRRDEMIKTSGYRVSPTEIEEAIYRSGMVKEAAAFGIEDEALGQRIHVVVLPEYPVEFDSSKLRSHLRETLPAYMVPQEIAVRGEALPRNPNGKIDRKLLAAEAQNG